MAMPTEFREPNWHEPQNSHRKERIFGVLVTDHETLFTTSPQNESRTNNNSNDIHLTKRPLKQKETNGCQ